MRGWLVVIERGRLKPVARGWPYRTVVGAVTSGLAMPFSGPQGSGRMVTAACAGTWAITPAVLKGQEPVRFVGGSSSNTRPAR